MKWIPWIDCLITVGCFGIAVLCFAVTVYDLYDVTMISMIFQVWAIVTVMLLAIRLALQWRTLSRRGRLAKSVLMMLLFCGVIVLMKMMGAC